MPTATPAWQAATSGQAPKAAHINQFLGVHTFQNLYSGVLKESQTTAGSSSTASNGLYIAQQFTTAVGQTTVGYVSIPLTTTTTSGVNLATTTISLYTDNAGAPGTTILGSTVLTAEYANFASGGTATVNVLYPLPISGLTASTAYWLVTAPAGTSGNKYTWYQSNQVSGASTSPDGTTWTAQAYGLLYKVYDQTASGLLTATWEDSGDRWTVNTYTALDQISTYAEYTAGQTASGYAMSTRTMTYSNSFLTQVA